MAMTKLSEAVGAVDAALAQVSGEPDAVPPSVVGWYRSRVRLLGAIAQVIESRAVNAEPALAQLNSELRSSLLAFASGSESNVRATTRLELRRGAEGGSPIEYAFEGMESTLTDLLDSISEVPVSALASALSADNDLASMSQEQWEDAVRILQLFVLTLEG